MSQFAVLVGDHEGDQSMLRDYADTISNRTSLALPPRSSDSDHATYQSGSQTARADRTVSFSYQPDQIEPVRGHVRSRSNMAFSQQAPTPRFSIRATEVEEYNEQSINQHNNAQSLSPPQLSKKTFLSSVILIAALFLISRLSLIDWSSRMSIDGHGELTINSHFYSPFCSKEVHSMVGPVRSGQSTVHSINQFLLKSVHVTCLSTMVVLDAAPRLVFLTIGVSFFVMILLMLRDQLIHPTMKRKAIFEWIGQSLLTGPFAVQRYRAVVTNHKDNKQS